MKASDFLIEGMAKKFVSHWAPWIANKLELETLPPITVLPRPVETSFGGYDPKTKSIGLVVAGRHPVDVLRTLAHELTHYKQDLEGKLYAGAGETGTPEENEANSNAGVIMRDFAQANPEYFGLKHAD